MATENQHKPLTSKVVTKLLGTTKLTKMIPPGSDLVGSRFGGPQTARARSWDEKVSQSLIKYAEETPSATGKRQHSNHSFAPAASNYRLVPRCCRGRAQTGAGSLYTGQRR